MTPVRAGGRSRWDAARKATNARRLRDPLGEPEVRLLVDDVLPKTPDAPLLQPSRARALWVAYARAFRAFKETPAGATPPTPAPDWRTEPERWERAMRRGREARAAWYRAAADFLGAAANHAASVAAQYDGEALPLPARRTGGADPSPVAAWIRTVVGFLTRSDAATHRLVLVGETHEFPPWTPAELEALRCAWNRDPRLGDCRACPLHNVPQSDEGGCRWKDGPRLGGARGPLPWDATARSTVERTLRRPRSEREDAGLPAPPLGDILAFALEWTDPTAPEER